jgi:hypothetical protein
MRPNPIDIHEKPADRLSFRYTAASTAGRVHLRISRSAAHFCANSMFQNKISLAAMADALSRSATIASCGG